MDDKSGYIYLMSCDNEYKIGKTKNNVDSRRLALQTARAKPIKVVHTLRVQDRHKAERMLHSIFANEHIHGEWYTLSAQSMQIIADIFMQTLDSQRLERLGLKRYE